MSEEPCTGYPESKLLGDMAFGLLSPTMQAALPSYRFCRLPQSVSPLCEIALELLVHHACFWPVYRCNVAMAAMYDEPHELRCGCCSQLLALASQSNLIAINANETDTDPNLPGKPSAMYSLIAS